jgi:hypothetical protein
MPVEQIMQMFCRNYSLRKLLTSPLQNTYRKSALMFPEIPELNLNYAKLPVLPNLDLGTIDAPNDTNL